LVEGTTPQRGIRLGRHAQCAAEGLNTVSH
jgi:hypothetical protein